jgi:hypothetical protein
MNPLAGFICLDLVNCGVEVQNMHTLGPLPFDDGSNLCLEEGQLPRTDRVRAPVEN